MKYLQLLTFVLATLPHCTTALFLLTGTSNPYGLYNQSSISSTTTSTSFSTSSSGGPPVVPSMTTSSSNGTPILPTTSPAFPGGSTSSSAGSLTALSNSTVSTTSRRFGTFSSTAPIGTAAGSQSSSSAFPSNTSPLLSPPAFPTGSNRRPSAPNSAPSSGGPIFPTRPNHKPSSISGLPFNGHIMYHGTSAAHKYSVFPKATGTVGPSGLSSGIFPPGGTGKASASSGAPKGVFPPSGTGQASGSSGIHSGIFPPTGTNPGLTASGGANSSVPTRAASCGLCDVIIPQVQVVYFPVDPNPGASCTQGPGAGPSITPPPAPALVKRRLARRNGTFTEDIAVSDGYTFTAPSMYVVMSQGIQVTDLCGTIGSTIASATVAVSSGSLSTISYNIAVGETLTDAIETASTYTKPLLAEDLACPTWGISGNWNPRPESNPLDMPGGGILNVPAPAAPGATTLAVIGEVQDGTTVGAPWYPIIVLPHEVLSLDPLWASCEGRLVNPSFPIFDPPRPLQAEAVLVSSTGPAIAQAQTTGQAGGNNDGGSLIASPVQPVNPALTGGGQDTLVKLPESQLIAASPLALAPPVVSGTNQGVSNTAAPAYNPSNVAAAVPAGPAADTNAQITAAAANPPASSPAAPNDAFIQSLSAALAVSTVNIVPIPAANTPAVDQQAATNHQAATNVQPATNHQLAANVASSPAQNQPAATAPTPLTVAGQQVQQQGSNLVVGGQSIAPGNTGTVSGHQVVNNGNNVVVDGSSQAIQPNPTPAPAPLPSVGGQQIQQQGSNLVVAGQTIAPGSSGSVGGHSVVNNGDNVVVDGSSQAIQPTPAPVFVAPSTGNDATTGGVAPAFQGEGGNAPPNSPAPAATPLPSVGGQQIQQQGSNLVVAGQTIAPGASAAVAGHQVVNNVNDGNAVVVDGSSQALPPAGITPAPAASPVITIGGTPYTADSSSNFVVDGQTLNANNPITVSGTPVSILPGSSAVAVGSETQAISQATPGAAEPVITIGGTPYTADSSSNFVVNGQTLNANNPITVSGTPVSILPGSSSVAIGSVTQAISQATPGVAEPVITVGGTPYTADSSSNFVINGQTLNPSNPITVSGTPISILPGNTAVAIGSSTQAITTPPPNINNANSPAQIQPPLTIDGSTYYPTGPSSAYVLPSGQTLTPGAQITVGGTPVSLASDGSMAVVGGSTENLAPTITPPPGQPALTFDGTTYHPIGASSAYIIGGQTLTAGAGPITVSGTPISLASNGETAVVGSSTENLQPPITGQPGLTFDGTTFQPTNVAGASSAYVIDGQTITPGAGPVTISGTPISLAPNGAIAVIGGITQDLGPSATPEPAITFDGSTYHPITGAPSDYIIGSQTLAPGGVITVSGTPISLATNGASAIIGSSTQNLQMTEPPLTFDGSTYYPTGPSSAYVIAGQTITPGASVTISGTPISLASNGASAVVGTSTEDLQPSLTSGAVLTVGGQTFTPNPSSFVLGGKTMTVGGSAIISGTPVALEPSGTLMVGTSEIPLASATGKIVGSSNKPLTGAAARKSIPWASLAISFIGTGFLYIL